MDDLAALGDVLAGTRLVTLTGPPGVGKTRLAAAFAAEVAARAEDGVWFVELAALGDPTALDEVIAAQLGLTGSGPSRREVLLTSIGRRDVLLVLDNAEHLTDAVGELVGALLARCPSLHVVVTSREPVGVDGERVLTVRSLPVDAATVLFTDRARSANPDVPLTAGIVEQICRQLDGIPMAIELAAARVRSLSPGEIHRRLQAGFDLLTARRRTTLERHRTIRAAIDWSYQLLEEPERLLFDRLSVFAGGFDLAAAEAVAGYPPIAPADVLDLLDQLTAKSLVVAEVSEAASRYRLLQSLRDFAAERLDAGAAVAADRHAAYYTAYAETHGGFDADEDPDRIDRLVLELDNLRAAVAYAIAVGDAERALRLTTSLVHLWWTFDHAEVGHWIGQAANLEAAAQHPLGRAAHGQAALAAAFRVDVPAWQHHLDHAEGTWWEAYARGWWPTSPEQHLEVSRRAGELSVGEHPRAQIRAGSMHVVVALHYGKPYRAELDRLLRLADPGWDCGGLLRLMVAAAEAVRAGDVAAALVAHDEALALEEGRYRRRTFAWHTAAVPRMLWRFGVDPATGLGLALDYLVDARNMGSLTWIQCALARVAPMLHRLGRHESAAALAAFTRDPPGAVALVDGDPAEPLVEVLSHGPTAQAWRRGTAMSFDDAIQLALDELAGALADVESGPATLPVGVR